MGKLSRRDFLKSTAAASLAMVAPGMGFAGTTGGDARFILLILRGGMDGLAAVPAYGDKNYHSIRGELALPEPGRRDGILDLDGYFGLHPDFVGLHGIYQAGELLVIQGIAPPYRQRSHFDAQNVLETGVPTPHARKDGWLYRGLAAVGNGQDIAMSIGPSVPLVLRGDLPVGSWAPDYLPDPDDGTLLRLLALYQHDPVLGPSVESMMETQDILAEMGEPRAGGRNLLKDLAGAAARFMNHADGPRIAVLESGGWDTHANQGSTGGVLAARFRALDDVLSQLKAELGRSWPQTVIVLVTEFGRTAAMNGTRGTDHGVGGAALVLGGAVRGGRVISDWAGLGKQHLYQGRDVMPAIDQRSLFKAVLVDHMGADPAMVEERVFPDSRDVKSLTGLLRAVRAS